MGQGHLRLYNGPWDRTLLQSEATHQGFWQDWLTTGCVRGLSFVMCYFWCWSNQRSVLTIFRLPLCDVVVTDYDVKSDFMEHFFFYMYKLLASPDSWSLCIIYISIFMILFNMRPVTKRSQSVWSHPQWGHPDFYILVSTDELQDFDRLLVKKSCYYKFSTVCTFTEQEKNSWSKFVRNTYQNAFWESTHTCILSFQISFTYDSCSFIFCEIKISEI